MRKNFLRTFALSALFSAMLATPAFAENATVTGSEVNLRDGPGANYRVIDSLKRGATVNVTDRSNGAWYAVEYDGGAGFMSSAYLRFEERDEIPTVATDGESGYISAMYVRFRSGPGSGYSILGEYNRGKTVTITGETGDWTACTIDGEPGYIYSDYVSRGSAQAVDEYLGGYNGGSSKIPDTSGDEYGGTGPAPSATQRPQAPSVSETPLAPLKPIVTDAPAQTPTPTQRPTPTQKPTPTPTPTLAPIETGTPSDGTQSERGYINGDYVRFRTGPGTSYSIIDSYNRGKTLEIKGTSGEWTACVIDGQSGYVFSTYVMREVTASVPSVIPPAQSTQAPQETEQPLATLAPAPTPTPTESKDGYISGNNVRMRSGPSMSSGIVDELFFGNAVTITGTTGEWTAVTYNGKSGYVYSTYVKEGKYSYTDTSSSATGSAEGRDIVNYALQFVGYNYSWGGKSPDTGFDCSGLVYYVYQHFGYTLNRVAADQAKNGVHVDESDLQPGDILCFYSGSSYIGHVGIYIGDGKFVHAANSATGVIVTELAGYYSTRGYEARRIV